MSDNFWNRNQNASDSNGGRRRIVLALSATKALGNDGPRRGEEEVEVEVEEEGGCLICLPKEER
jgi:hypothetical protein